MPLRRHHKIIIGSFSSLVVIFMIVGSIFVYTLSVKQGVDYINLNNKISTLEADTQSKLNELTETIIQAEQELQTLGSQVGSLDNELVLLKASAGEDFSGIIEDAIKSVVTIRTDVSQGTGFILTDDGYIVTNAHVLVGATYVQILTYEQGTINADMVGYDENLDIVLLKVEGNYDPISLGDSNDVQVGEKVIAIGNPLGLQFSVSEGIVSAVNREGPSGLEAYIQTDAALNPGNSGGPLINKKGKVIGINNFKIGGGESLGFALESNYIKSAVNDIAEEELEETLL
jgi:S1-C subfamily serine protease